MNIRQAKEYIKHSVHIYLKKNEFGEYCIPVVRQRPIFLLGAPGIGKTAIMEQIAQEMGIALVSYSMTHHTRQSALGLPFIAHKSYEGEHFDVSEYTMSEIIASIYETMAASGLREGILFLDEINCVSETLAPSMLQFLQYKVFGRHHVPEGWVIVTAGNPPEYNKSVREFDVVTYDRLRLLSVEPDYAVWKQYAVERGVHGAVINFLDLKKDFFYHMEMTTKGRSYVTARGWEDLSEILYHYEEEALPVDEALVEQYIRNDRIVREFTAYYDLFNKYKQDYRMEEILEGRPSEAAFARAKEAAFDERLSLLGMLLDRVQADMREVMETSAYLTDLRTLLLSVKGKCAEEAFDAEACGAFLEELTERKKDRLHALERAGSLSREDRRKHNRCIRFLQEGKKALYTGETEDKHRVFEVLKARFESEVADMRLRTQETSDRLHALFSFVERAYTSGNEMLILVTELTVNSSSAQFIANFGSPDYRRHNNELMLSERQDEMQRRIAELNL